MTKLLSLTLLIALCSFSHAQYHIIDSETKKAVSYAHVKTTDFNTGEIANYNGEFLLDSSFIDVDTLVISCIGYKSRFISMNDLSPTDPIELVPSAKNLNEVIVSAKRDKFQLKKLGINKNPKTMFFDNTVTGDNGVEKAVWMSNEYDVPGFVKTVNVYVSDLGFPDAHFRIHVYASDPFTNEPGKELTHTNIIASGIEGDEWVTIDLSDQYIQIPETGCFVGIEWFDSPKSEYYQDTLFNKISMYVNGEYKDTIYRQVRRGNGMALGSRPEAYAYSKNKLWYRSLSNNQWINHTTTNEARFNIPDTLASGTIHIINEKNLYFRIPCIYVEVSFPKSKIKTQFKDPKKRKFNQFEKVKEDSFKYPQSNISELFSSLIKAFENNDVIYVLKYLCVYDQEEQDKIIQTLENNQTEFEDYIAEEELERIIEHLIDFQKKMDPESLIKVDDKHFKVQVENDSYDLIIDQGKWKINPYSYKVMK